MIRRVLVQIAFVFSAGCFLLDAVVVASPPKGPMYVDTTLTPKTVNGNGQATGTVLAYTDDNGNKNVGNTLNNNQVNPLYSGPGNTYGALTIPASVKGVPANMVPKFTPPVGLTDFAKNTNSVVVSSSSYNAADFANKTLQGYSSILWNPGANPSIHVEASTDITKNAYAAARGIDPVPIAYGTQLELNPTIDISLGIRPGDWFATTSMGEELASLSSPLWSLTVSSTGVTPGNEYPILNVDFTSLSSLGLDDNQIANNILNSFTLSTDSAVMNQPMTFFDAFYTVSSPTGDTYSDSNSGAIATPEPSTFVLAVLGGLALLAYRRCRS